MNFVATRDVSRCGSFNPSTCQFFDFLIDIGLHILLDGLIRPQSRQQKIMLLLRNLYLDFHYTVTFIILLSQQNGLILRNTRRSFWSPGAQ